MYLDQQHMNSLLDERAEIVKSTRLHAVHWCVVALSLVVTFGAWQFSRSQVDAAAASQFQIASEQVLELVSERMQKYEDGLWGGVSAIQAQGGDISNEQWRIFADHLRIDLKYPGISGIGVIRYLRPSTRDAYLEEQRQTRPEFRIFPEHIGTEFFPVTHLEPAAPNARAIGLDIAHETNRYTAAREAGDSGAAQITGPISLVQDEGHASGFLFYAPYYDGGVYDTLAERREHFKGMVYAPFVFHKLMEGVLDQSRREVRFAVRDVMSTLYDESTGEASAADESGTFKTTLDLELYGRTWTFDIWATPGFQARIANSEPTVILIGGLSIDLLLLSLFVLLTKSNRRAVDFVDHMTSELQQQTNALQKSNSELEKFVYITSHDLKTPLRGIGDLAEYLEEDLAFYMDGPNPNPDVQHNLGRLHQQVKRMDALIKGILDYSKIRADPGNLEDIDLAALVTNLQVDLGLEGTQIVVKGPLPILFTDATRLQQVFTNLISNAIKYHHDPKTAEITVCAVEQDDSYSISVSDNGPGIDPRFHGRIFEVFQTLQSWDEGNSTGIGLSIVKKAVEVYGGSITIFSELGKGATFTFEWPKVIQSGRQRVAA